MSTDELTGRLTSNANWSRRREGPRRAAAQLLTDEEEPNSHQSGTGALVQRRSFDRLDATAADHKLAATVPALSVAGRRVGPWLHARSVEVGARVAAYASCDRLPSHPAIRRIGGPPEKLAESLSVSPTVLQSGPYRFFFFSSDRNEPIHVHVKRDHKLAKVWLAPVRVAYNFGFSPTELKRIADLVQEHQAALSEAWHEYFKRRNGNGGGKERSGH